MSETTRILVVDDEPALLAATARVLKSAGFDVLEATTGAQCLEIARERRPDLVLLNIVLPDIDGRQVCRELKADPLLESTFVVLASGRRTDAADRVAGLDSGADGYVFRPISNRELLAWIRAFVRISRAEAALRRSNEQAEQRHALSVAAALDGVWEWDIASGTVHYSDRFCELLGYRSNEVPGRLDFLRSISHPHDAGAVWAAVERHLEGGKPYDVECRLRRKKGEYAWFRARGMAHWDRKGRATWMAGSIQDITERKRAERALRQSEHFLAESQEVARLGNWWWDMASNEMHWSTELFRILGVSSQDTKPSKQAFLGRVHPDDRPVLEKSIAAILAKRDPFSIDHRIVLPDGSIRFVHSIARLDVDADNKPVRLYGILQDITERKQAEAERKITVQLLSQASVAKSLNELLSGITSVLQRWSGCEAVGVRLRDGDDYPYYETRGFSTEFVLAENRLCAVDDRGHTVCDGSGRPVLECMCGNVLCGRFDPTLPFFTEKGSFWTGSSSELLVSTTEAERQVRTRNRCNGEGYESVALIPLRAAGETFGLLQFNDKRKGMFSAHDIERFERLAYNVASAVARQKAVEALRTSEENLREERYRLAEAQRIAHLGSWDWNIVSNELSWSDEVYRIFGLQPRQFRATYNAFLESVHAEDREAVEEAVNRSLADPDAPYSIEHRIVRPDGSQRVVHERGNVTFDQAGRPGRMIGTVQDVSELKEAERKLRDALREVEILRDRLRAENIYLQEEIKSDHDFDEIVGQSGPLRVTLSKIEQVAGTDANVFLLGETGTGKELLARAIHHCSARKDRPLVKVNCAALPASLIESELFGHVKGAFTGAVADKVGRFELAHGGTLFLDEIGELDPNLQTKLLRVLQDGEFERIGSAETTKVDVRLIAATNRDLHTAMSDGTFRPDLYYRLAVFPIEVPPLRLRRDDIPLLVWHFVQSKRARLGKTITSVPDKVMTALVEYDWPGNVRELENVVERAMILSPGPNLVLEGAFAKTARDPLSEYTSANLEDIDRAHIVRVLDDCGWRIKGTGNAADRLGLKPSTLRYRMRKLDIQRPPRRPR